MVLTVPGWIQKSILQPLAIQIASPKNSADNSPAFSIADALRDPKRILLIPDNQPGGIFIGASKFLAIREQYPSASLDLLVHRPDLTLAGDPPKLGLGLWNIPLLEMPLEIALTLGATVAAFAAPRDDRRLRRWAAGAYAAAALLCFVVVALGTYVASLRTFAEP